MNLKLKIKKALKEHLSSIILTTNEFSDSLHGIIDENIFFSLTFSKKGDIILFRFANSKTFERWENSTDLESKAYTKWSMVEIIEKLDESINLARILFKYVPVKYWNDCLMVEY